jgi:predicted RNA binding protein YcfA (HicA-like mRNA interferase family)
MRKSEACSVLKSVKVRGIIKLIEQDGWSMVRIMESHRQFKHTFKKGLVTIAGHLNDD